MPLKHLKPVNAYQRVPISRPKCHPANLQCPPAQNGYLQHLQIPPHSTGEIPPAVEMYANAVDDQATQPRAVLQTCPIMSGPPCSKRIYAIPKPLLSKTTMNYSHSFPMSHCPHL